MIARKSIPLRLWSILILVLSISMLTTCSSSDNGEAATATITTTSSSEGLHTWLLVGAPESFLPAGQSITVRSRSEDAQNGISHIELYLVEFRPEAGNDVISNLLIRSDAAPFQQTSFTASQAFTPKQPGNYIIKVRGYNKIGQSEESETLSFVVR